jgi:bifunctional DNase/RNase
MEEGIIPVEVKGIYMVGTATGHTPVVLLTDDGHRFLPIYIGISEALSINAALKREVPSRPMTHDLIISILDNVNAQITEVTIDEVENGIYYATLSIKVNGSERQLDARPSDCIALAVRSNIEIFIKESILDEGTITKDDINAKEMEFFF